MYDVGVGMAEGGGGLEAIRDAVCAEDGVGSRDPICLLQSTVVSLLG